MRDPSTEAGEYLMIITDSPHILACRNNLSYFLSVSINMCYLFIGVLDNLETLDNNRKDPSGTKVFWDFVKFNLLICVGRIFKTVLTRYQSVMLTF